MKSLITLLAGLSLVGSLKTEGSLTRRHELAYRPSASPPPYSPPSSSQGHAASTGSRTGGSSDAIAAQAEVPYPDDEYEECQEYYDYCYDPEEIKPPSASSSSYNH
ncbi:hypothetical protein DSO57_1011135 [Entomophthora muscae]|uniref:Uncharacterized protein n=1 Tax=Entomophthora muscae TaxID=34485 RepID=A0ACC2U4S6_9FUNG|nr:hypothetical protein DSO57_1011135 [Entomophthora muscae]